MAEEPIKEVRIFTDGGALGNPGPGGYGVVLLYGDHRKEISGGFRLTTNNRMELMAAIVGLSALKTRCRVQIFSDSKYLVDAMSEGWAENWRDRNWRRKGRGAALNPDLWERLLELCRHHNVTFSWVRGHNGEKENERCDKLAVEAARGSDLPPDEKFERSKGLSDEEPKDVPEE